MTTTATTPSSIDLSSASKVSLGRLAKVELRKSIDTRAGRWFTVSIVAICLVVVTIMAFVAPSGEKDYVDILSITGAVLGSFLPVLIIMLVCSEANQRTGLVTFTLEPRRPRVVLAKFLAGLALGVGVMVVASLIAGIGTFLGTLDGSSVDWSLDANLVFNGFVLSNLVGILFGFGIAMLLMNTPAAIVAYFVYSVILPQTVLALGYLSTNFEKIAPWIEFNTAQYPLFSGDYKPTGEQWAQIAVAGTIWVLIPLLLGIKRLLRTEFK